MAAFRGVGKLAAAAALLSLAIAHFISGENHDVIRTLVGGGVARQRAAGAFSEAERGVIVSEREILLG